MYLILRGNEALVVDPNINEEVIPLFKTHGVRKVYILLTHEHYDHISGVAWMQERFDCTLICNPSIAKHAPLQATHFPVFVALVQADKDRSDGGHRYEDFKNSFTPFTVRVDQIYNTTCQFNLMGMKFSGVATPGHSPGSWCLMVDDAFIFTGDTLIKDTPAIIRFKESHANEFKKITLPFLRSLDPELWVLPGHFDPFKMKDNNILHTYDV
jgi:glyoxylase-like metal-dependent hydrolase (beta-lactamase superfamily II)